MPETNIPDGKYDLPYLFEHYYLWYEIASEMLMYNKDVQTAAVEQFRIDNPEEVYDDIAITIDYIEDHKDLFECTIEHNQVCTAGFKP